MNQLCAPSYLYEENPIPDASITVKIWNVTRAARYNNGVLLESYDGSFRADMLMVSYQDYLNLLNNVDFYSLMKRMRNERK